MIPKAAVLERAKEWQLTPEVIEKDYVLGWFLAGLENVRVTNEVFQPRYAIELIEQAGAWRW